MITDNFSANVARERDIHRHARFGNEDDMMSCLNEGVNIDTRGEYGLTPLMIASQYDRVDMVLLLLNNGANESLLNYGGNIAYRLAYAKGNKHAMSAFENFKLGQSCVINIDQEIFQGNVPKNRL